MNDLIKLLRGRRIDGRSADEIMRLAADEIESLQSQLSYRIEERDDSNRNLTAALRREVAYKDRLAEAEALRNGLKNCMLLAARHRKEIGDWQHIIRFCIEAGVQMSPLRETDAVLAEPTKEQP